MMLNVQPGDIVLVEDWLGESYRVKVSELVESPTHGEGFCGWQVDEELSKRGQTVCWRHVALPLSMVLVSATLTRVGRGKWDLGLPSGVERYGSRKAAKDRVDELGLVLTED